MPRYVKDGAAAIETSDAREGVTLKAQGFHEEKARTKAIKAADEAKPEPTK